MPSGSVAALRASLTAAPERAERVERAPLPPVPRAPLAPLPESPGAPGKAGGPPPSATVRARLSAFAPRDEDSPRRPTGGKAARAERARDASILRELNDLRAMPRVESSRSMYTAPAAELAQGRLSAAAYKTDASQYYI